MRPPDFTVGDKTEPYMERWHVLPRNSWFNIYLHHFLHSDEDEALHDHPYLWNISLLLRGNYLEHLPGGRVKLRRSPRLVFRWGRATHRIELIAEAPVWTLFLTGPRVREWGFYCPQGWKHWREFVNARDSGPNSKGCG